MRLYYYKNLSNKTTRCENSMNIQTLQHWLDEHIPACRLLGLQICQADLDKVVVSADFTPNHNHHNTIFGGSQSLLATACAWLAVNINFPDAGGNIVIRQSHIRYLAPATGDVLAVCQVDGEQKRTCQQMLGKVNKGKITVACGIFCQDKQVAVFEGEFVVFRS